MATQKKWDEASAGLPRQHRRDLSPAAAAKTPHTQRSAERAQQTHLCSTARTDRARLPAIYAPTRAPLRHLLQRGPSLPRPRPHGGQAQLQRRDTAPRLCEVAILRGIAFAFDIVSSIRCSIRFDEKCSNRCRGAVARWRSARPGASGPASRASGPTPRNRSPQP